jgi:molybdate transport system substrate-binding protein
MGGLECADQNQHSRESSMFHHFRLPVLIAAVFLAAPATSGTAAEIKVLDANALTIAMKEIAADFTKDTGNQVTFVGVNPGQVEQRIKAGEMYDLVVTAAASAQAFEKEGKWRPGTLHPLARVGIGVAVRDGVKVDLSTVESTRKLLLDAKTITHSDSSGAGGGLSGINAAKVLVNLGIADAVKAKTKISGSLADGQALIGKGEIDLGLFNLSEIPRAPGVVRAGPVPAAVEVYINYDSAIPATNTAPEAALALVKYFQRAASKPVWDKAGLEVVGSQ